MPHSLELKIKAYNLLFPSPCTYVYTPAPNEIPSVKLCLNACKFPRRAPKVLDSKRAEEIGCCWSHLLWSCQMFEREYAACPRVREEGVDVRDAGLRSLEYLDGKSLAVEHCLPPSGCLHVVYILLFVCVPMSLCFWVLLVCPRPCLCWTGVTLCRSASVPARALVGALDGCMSVCGSSSV